MENAAIIVSMFGQALVEELQEIRGVGDKVVHLRDELASMNAILRMLAEADEDCVDHLVREWIKQVRELASDSEDCVDIYKLRIRRPLPRQPVDPGARLNCASRLLGHATLLPGNVWLLFRKLFWKRSLAADLQDLLARMVIISERRARYGIDREALRRSASFAAVSPVTLSARALRPANDPKQFIGLKGQVDTLAQTLRSGDDDHEDTSVKVFSIVGFGGLGKTTLAMEVCRELEKDFQYQAQVSVSLAFDAGKDLEGLLRRMLHQMMIKRQPDDKGGAQQGTTKVDSTDGMGVPELINMLQDILTDKRYLIVIDDVWTIPAWEAIRSILPTGNKNKSRIIVTTREESVAKACSSVGATLVGDFVHHMEPLEPEDSKKLFINRVFGPEGTCPSELEDRMNNILRKCGGLPLAIVSMASLLASYKSPESIEMWDKISKSMGSQLESNPTLQGMRQIITLSYSHLPHHLKICMLYLSIFPEDYEIKKQRLLSRWIAEGLVTEKRGLTLQEVAESYFDDLMSRNMIVPASFSHAGRVKTCRVHDMMLEVIMSRALEANFVSLVGGQQCEEESLGKIRRLSVQSGGGPKVSLSQSTKRSVVGSSLKHVRSLSTFHPQGHELLLERLGEFTLLRVLDLQDCKAVEDRHMKQVCQMFLLKYLNLDGCFRIRHIPEEIRKLVHLQTLSVRRIYDIDFPPSMTELEKLEFLYTHDHYPWYLPRDGLWRMKALRVLDKVVLNDYADTARDFGDLTQLRKLNIQLGNICSKEVLQVLGSALNKIYSLRSLSIEGRGQVIMSDVLQQMTAPPLLRSMLIDGKMEGMPEWFGWLPHIVKLHMVRTELSSSDEILGVLCKLPNLLSLTLGYKCYSNDSLLASTQYPFPALKKLILVSPPEHEHVTFIFEQGSMAMLEKLGIYFEKKETSLTGVEHLPSLKEVLLVGFRSYDSMSRIVEQLKSESGRRPVPNQFNVVARYYD